MTLAGNNLSLCDKRYSDEFLRHPTEHESKKSHIVCVTQAKEARKITEDHHEDDEDTDVENALAALNEDDSADLEETDV